MHSNSLIGLGLQDAEYRDVANLAFVSHSTGGCKKTTE